MKIRIMFWWMFLGFLVYVLYVAFRACTMAKNNIDYDEQIEWVKESTDLIPYHGNGGILRWIELGLQLGVWLYFILNMEINYRLRFRKKNKTEEES